MEMLSLLHIIIGDYMIRTILICLYLVLFLVCGIPVQWILTLLEKKYPGIKANVSSKLVKNAFKVCLFLSGTKVTVHGIENIPTNQQFLFVGNHRSYFDILVSYVASPIPLGYIAKKEMEKIPLLSTWMRSIHCLFLDRKNIKEGMKTILAGTEILKSGYSLCIFPEGTRSKEAGLLPFKEGSTKMAEKAKVPILPMALSNTDAIFEKNPHNKIKAASVTLTFGKPVYIDQLDADNKKFLGAYLQKQIETMLEEHQR